MKPIRLLVVDDHALLRSGLISLLKGMPEFQVVGEAAEVVEEARQLARGHELRGENGTGDGHPAGGALFVACVERGRLGGAARAGEGQQERGDRRPPPRARRCGRARGPTSGGSFGTRQAGAPQDDTSSPCAPFSDSATSSR